MFTGIISDIGTISRIDPHGDLHARISCQLDLSKTEIGASIACDGVCLTVVEKGDDWFDVNISAETLSVTNLHNWTANRLINLEKSLKVGDELGGHIVSGHVDGLATLIGLRDEGESTRMTFDAPVALAKFIAPKGSVALNGTSLTVNEVDGTTFGINVIPHTKSQTTWSSAKVGDKINLEIDTLARYVARLAEMS